MKELTVTTSSKQYPIYFDSGFAGLAAAFQATGLSGRKACIITDATVRGLYSKAVLLATAGIFSSVSVCSFAAGEEYKTLDIIQLFYQHFFEHQLDRKSVIVALGGGVTGDMAGFAAATYLRGISFVQIPTTLLSQVDSSVGGKTGVDFMGAKNMIGAFYQPEFVYINTATLRTLPEEQFVSGMGEVIKHGLIHDKAYLDFITENRAEIVSQQPDVLRDLIYGSCKIKAEIVGLDEKEQGLREILNFGHTFGHAVESLYHFELPHGHCVGLGMCAALHLSYIKGALSEQALSAAKATLAAFGLPVFMDGGIFNEEQLLAQMTRDKKARDGRIHLVLLARIGHAYTYPDAARAEIMAGIAAMGRRTTV